MTKNTDLRREIANMKKMFGDVRKDLSDVKADYADLKMDYADLTTENVDLKNTVKKLTKALAYYDNAHTPPSHKTLTQQAATRQRHDNREKPANKRPVGAQKGSKGVTNKPKATEFQTYTPKRCPRCKTKFIPTIKTLKDTITDAPKPPKPITTEYTIHVCECKNCDVIIIPGDVCSGVDSADSKPDNTSDVAIPIQSLLNNKKLNLDEIMVPLIVKDKNVVKGEKTLKCVESVLVNARNPITSKISILPKYGTFGKNIQMSLTQFFLNRMPIRMIADNINEMGVKISTGAVYNNLSRIGIHLTEPTHELLDTIRRAPVLHIDETSMSLNGKNIWVWIFFDPSTSTVLYVMANSRGSDVLGTILPWNWQGIIVCDGWGSYKRYRTQRCWSHIICESRNLAQKNPDDESAQCLLKRLRAIYKRACGVRGSKKKRHDARSSLLRSIRYLLSQYANNSLCETFITKLGNAKNDLFEFVIDRNIPSTNNAAERGLREIVIHRKIRGGIRSVTSMVSFANLLSCATTWRLRGMRYLEEIVRYS